MRSVQAHASEGGTVSKIIYRDENGVQIGATMQHGNRQAKEMHSIGENAQLIGVYGQKDLVDWFVAFGFIVKVEVPPVEQDNSSTR